MVAFHPGEASWEVKMRMKCSYACLYPCTYLHFRRLGDEMLRVLTGRGREDDVS